MNDSDDWDSLRDAWSDEAPATLPDLEAMMARARRQRRRTLLLIGAEWAVALLALATLASQWRVLALAPLHGLWWGFVALVTLAVLALATATRVRALRGPGGASLRDWLALRERRALLDLRLVTLTRWTVIVLLPAPLFALAGGTGDLAHWRTLAAVSVPALVLAAGWAWARRQSRRLIAEREEVRRLAAEWLDEPRQH